MSDDPPKMSIAERVAALQNQGKGDVLPSLTKPKAKKTSALSDRIAALQKTAGSNASSDGASAGDKPKVGKLKKPPPGAVPIMPVGVGPPPSLLKKQKEREERMAKLQQEANATEDEPKEVKEKPKVGKLKPPAGAVPIVPFGAGPPPSLLKKQKEREERMANLQQEAKSTEDGNGASRSGDVDADEALMTRPTIKGKRRPRTRT